MRKFLLAGACAPVATACGGDGGAPIAQPSATPEVGRDTSPANIDPWQITLASLTGAISWGGDAFRVRTDYERTSVVIRRSGYEDVLISTGVAYVARADDAAPKEGTVKVTSVGLQLSHHLGAGGDVDYSQFRVQTQALRALWFVGGGGADGSDPGAVGGGDPGSGKARGDSDSERTGRAPVARRHVSFRAFALARRRQTPSPYPP